MSATITETAITQSVSTSFNIDGYLRYHTAVKGEGYTHTRIGNKDFSIYGGTYYINPNEWKDFMLNYCEMITKNKKEYLTEKQLEDNGPILLDFDFRYPAEIVTRQHSKNHIIDVVMLYADKILELVDIPINQKIEVFAMEKKDVNCLNDKTKDGIHIIFGLAMNKGLQILLRDKVLPEIKNLWDDLPITNSWDDVIDEGVVKGQSNWQLYGSRKPGNQAYKVKYHFEISTNDYDGWDFKELPMDTFSIKNNILKLSARYSEHPFFPMKEEITADFEKAKKTLHQLGKKTPKPSAIAIAPSPTNVTPNNELVELLDIIDIKYWTEGIGHYMDWLKLILAIKVSFPTDYKEVAIAYSKRPYAKNPSLFDEEAVLKTLETEVRNVSAGTINYYAKLSNKDKYFEIKSKNNIELDNTDMGFAQTYLRLTNDEIIKVDGIHYIYEGRLWAKDVECKKIKLNMRNVLIAFYKKCLTIETKKMNDIPEDDKIHTAIIKQKIANITDAISLLKREQQQNNILKQVLLEIEEEDIKINKLKPYYFVFDNIAFDLKTGDEVVIQKDDYISQSTHYDYVKPSKKKIDEITTLLKQILPFQDYHTCYMSVLKSCLTGIKPEKFILANGGGRNGKGVISELMKALLGKDYFYKGNSLTLTSPLKNGSNPEIANMNMARMVLFSEPEEDQALSLGVIKALTGEDSINARCNYSNNTNTELTATFILEVNGKPNINGKINDAACERWINIYFPNCFTSKTHLIDNITKFPVNTLYKTLEWQTETRCALFDVLRKFKGNEIIISNSIESDTMDYLCSNDPLLKWFETTYDFIDTEKGKECIVKICDMFEELRQSDFYMNLSKKSKREEYTKKGLIDKIKENIKLKPYFFEKEKKIKEVSYKNYLTNCKRKEMINDDSDL
jgi:hypothetical protein